MTSSGEQRNLRESGDSDEILLGCTRLFVYHGRDFNCKLDANVLRKDWADCLAGLLFSVSRRTALAKRENT